MNVETAKELLVGGKLCKLKLEKSFYQQ